MLFLRSIPVGTPTTALGLATHFLFAIAFTAAFIIALFTKHSFAEDAGNLYNTPFDVRAGGNYFEKQCSRCHGFDAKGNDEVGAPDLTGRLRRASSSAGIFNILRSGISGTAMMAVDPNVPDAQLWQLAAYIESLGSDPANVKLEGSAEAGAALFSGAGNCLSCHVVAGQGGRLGPDLSSIGTQLNPDELTLALLEPSAEVAPRWWTLTVEDKSGKMYSGLRMNEDSFSVRIMDQQAQLWSFARSQLVRVDRSETSSMPSYANSLSDSQIDDLVAYLYSLRPEMMP
ncbi:MAG: c-type cytochrome [Gammaproteobacteria bacterium]|nr:c-type cytochrome [Gammaproteobacteria bacterium]